MPKNVQQDLATLSGARNGLIYLTANDWTLMIDKAKRIDFNAGDSIVGRGKKTNGVFLLLKGKARVDIPLQVAPRMIGPGEICGELSFLDELPASASVIAKEKVEALFLDKSTLQAMFELFPHLASRFYHSLAANLSYRLRDLIGSKAEGSGPGKAEASR